MKLLLPILTIGILIAAPTVSAETPTVAGTDGSVVFQVRDIPEGVPKEGHGKSAKKYGYRIPSLLTTSKGTVITFTERRLGLHDHAQNDIVLKRSTDGGKTWGKEIVAFEDGMNSINDPLTVQLADGRIMMMFARFPYGRHARASGWIKMAEFGYDNLETNVLTYITTSDDDGKTWNKPRNITRSVKPTHWVNANTPGAMIQLTSGKHKGRIITPLWGTIPVDGKRTWEILVAYSDDNGKTWQRTNPLNDPEKGFPNECQIAEASNGDLIIISRNQSGEKLRKKSISKDGGITWSDIKTDPTLPSVACMGSIIKGPVKKDGSWDLYASFPSSAGRKNGQIAISTDHGKTFQIKKIITGPFAYSATQISPDGKSLLCIYEANGYKTERILSIPLSELK
ncbi:sialidase [Oceaniferula spumae]|uniref:exo-alpha-sialidase n=1 Tax=Oceaniferula spumae TaxID=2979115 RepID=A0AAT9FRP2_9BACT